MCAMEQVCDFASWQCTVARADPHCQRIHIFATLQRLEIDQIPPSCLPYEFAQRSSAIRGPRHQCGGSAYALAMPSHHTASAIASFTSTRRWVTPWRCTRSGSFVCGYCCYAWAYPSQKPAPVKLFSALTWTQIGASVTEGSGYSDFWLGLTARELLQVLWGAAPGRAAGLLHVRGRGLATYSIGPGAW